MKTIFLLSLFVLSTFGAILYNEKEFGEITIQICTGFNRVYYDVGSGADWDGAFYRPACTNGARPLGHYAVRHYNGFEDVVLCVRPTGSSNSLVSPNSYTQTWNDRGSGGDLDGSFWAPNCPSGYRALGHVSVNGYGAPGTGEVYCVRNDLTKEGVISGEIWNDRGSGANSDGSFWRVGVPSSLSTVSSDRMLFAPNTYIGVGNYNVPSSGAYVLNLQPPTQQESLPPVTPSLSSCVQPSGETSNSFDKLVWVPRTAVSDPSTSFQWKTQYSPFYKVQRVSNYKLELFQTNQASVEQTLTKQITFGTSTSQSNTVSSETTLTIGFETGASFLGVGGKVTGSISQMIGYSSTTSVDNFKQTTTEFKLTSPPGKCNALWTQKDTLKFIRGDGSVINGATISFASGVTNVFYGEYTI